MKKAFNLQPPAGKMRKSEYSGINKIVEKKVEIQCVFFASILKVKEGSTPGVFFLNN